MIKRQPSTLARQRGSSIVEFVVVALALLIAWQGIGVVMDRFAEHQTEYTYSVSQPF